MKETVKKIALVKTNLFVCTVIILGFAVTSLISYHSNQGLFKQETENVSNLTAEGIYHKIESIFTKDVYKRQFPSRTINYWVMILPALIWMLAVNIVPMFGVVMAFQDFNPGKMCIRDRCTAKEQFQSIHGRYLRPLLMKRNW